MKQIVKSLNETRECFAYICAVFQGLNNEKKKAGNFCGSQIWKLIKLKKMFGMLLQKWYTTFQSIKLIQNFPVNKSDTELSSQ